MLTHRPRPLGSALTAIGGLVLVVSFFLPAVTVPGCSNDLVYPYEVPAYSAPYAAGLFAAIAVAWCYLRVSDVVILRGAMVLAIIGLSVHLLFGFWIHYMSVALPLGSDFHQTTTQKDWVGYLVADALWWPTAVWIVWRLRNKTSELDVAATALWGFASFPLTFFVENLVGSFHAQYGLFVSLGGTALMLAGAATFPPRMRYHEV